MFSECSYSYVKWLSIGAGQKANIKHNNNINNNNNNNNNYNNDDNNNNNNYNIIIIITIIIIIITTIKGWTNTSKRFLVISKFENFRISHCLERPTS